MATNEDYRKFWRRLSKAEREALIATGFRLDDPSDAGVPLAHRYFGGEPVDAEGGIKMDGYDIDRDAFWKWTRTRERGEEEPMTERMFTQEEVLDILSKVIAVIDLSPCLDVRLHGTCIKLALGMPGLPTMSSLAVQHGLTRAAISARVKTIQRNLRLPPSLYMKSDAACAKLSDARKKKLR